MLESKRLDGAEILVISPTPTWPLDHGNRKRIYSVCKSLKDRGAIIHFLYYPSEGDWRLNFPKQALHVMHEQWDFVYKVTPSIPLHTQSKGDSHLIDEWWDEAVENEVKWLTDTNTFDAVIVNYSWLSKALDFVPTNTLKVLDTHDRFSNRGELLQANGIKKEFFHTSQYEEAKALVRADLVWAIKHEEAEFFQKLLEIYTNDIIDEAKADAAKAKAIELAKNPLRNPQDFDDFDFDTRYRNTIVRTLLFVEEKETFSYASPYKQNRYLTVGIVGAYNNINLINTRAFLDLALPLFEKCMVPVKVILAGSMCRGLQDIQHPFLEHLGRVEVLDDFYSQLDIALIPMTFSTGLKIKAGEALAYGVPVIAHEHAFEGYPVMHPWQELRNLEEIALAVIDAATDFSVLQELKEATDKSQDALKEEVSQTLKHFTDSLKHHIKSVLIMLPLLQISSNSLYELRVLEILKNLGDKYRAIFYYEYDVTPEIQIFLETLSNHGIVTCKQLLNEKSLICDGMTPNMLNEIWAFELLWNLSEEQIERSTFTNDFYLLHDQSFHTTSSQHVDDRCDVLIQPLLPDRLEKKSYITWHHNFVTGRIEDIYKEMWKEKPAEACRALYILISGTKKQIQFWHKAYTALFANEYRLYWVIDSNEVDWPVNNLLDPKQVSMNYASLRDAARCAIMVNLSRSNLLSSIAWTIFVNKRRVYDIEEIAIDSNGTFTLYNFYKEMRQSVNDLGLNDYSNRFQHCSSHKIEFPEIYNKFARKKVNQWFRIAK